MTQLRPTAPKSLYRWGWLPRLEFQQPFPGGCTLIDVNDRLKETMIRLAVLFIALGLSPVVAQSPAIVPAHGEESAAGPPPSNGGFFPLTEVRRGMTGVAWTVFSGSKPEPMDVEILGVLRGARGPGHDMILAQLRGAKPEYTGVVAGMSGSPVYIGNRLLGSLSFRIGQFSKDPIAGITPIEQMLEVLKIEGDQNAIASREASLPASRSAEPAASIAAGGMTFQAMETPLVMGGFRPEEIRFWQQQMAGTGLEMVAAGGMGASSAPGGSQDAAASGAAIAALMPGSAVSAQLVRGDLEIAATCTVTYLDAKQLLACGHPLLQAGPVSLPMTATEVVATLASPLNAFKIINTGATIGSFSEDRDAAIRGVLGTQARMIPVHVSVHGPNGDRKLNVEIVDLAAITGQAVQVVLFHSLLENNENTAETSYHVTGNIDLEGYPPLPLDVWASAGGPMPAPMMAALLAGDRFSRIYSNAGRLGTVREINLYAEVIPRRVHVELETARLISKNVFHAGDTVMVEASIRPWRQPSRNIRIPVKLPARLGAGNLRMLVSDSGTLDRALDQPRSQNRAVDTETLLAEARKQHPGDHIYVSLLVPETQAGMNGQTLPSLPASIANALEPLRAAQDVSLNGESAEVAAEVPAGGVLTGFQVLNLRIEPGGGLN
jgi:hypothetical protein